MMDRVIWEELAAKETIIIGLIDQKFEYRCRPNTFVRVLSYTDQEFIGLFEFWKLLRWVQQKTTTHGMQVYQYVPRKDSFCGVLLVGYY